MTKKQMHQEINEQMYRFMNEFYPQYQEYDEMGGRISYINGNSKNSIEYHQSRHDVFTLNNASEECKHDCNVIELFLNGVISGYDL